MKHAKVKLKNQRTLVVDFDTGRKQIDPDHRTHLIGYIFVSSPDTQQKADSLARYATRKLGYNEVITPLVYFEDGQD